MVDLLRWGPTRWEVHHALGSGRRRRTSCVIAGFQLLPLDIAGGICFDDNASRPYVEPVRENPPSAVWVSAGLNCSE
ncbi:MAG: hypothetical protein IPP17_14900 [Bacteroidetes bacterium]|nr:hypothetical protein [Bacteroidota bacterium]